MFTIFCNVSFLNLKAIVNPIWAKFLANYFFNYIFIFCIIYTILPNLVKLWYSQIYNYLSLACELGFPILDYDNC